MQKNKILKGLITLSALAAMFCSAGVQAQTPTNVAQNGAVSQTDSSTKLSSGDEKALKDMAQANINEIAAAKIALKKAQSSDVKAFAQQMVEDHSAALTKVQAVAQQKGLALPTKPDAKHKAMAAKLEKQSGGAFDKMYMENAGKDPDVKALADAHLPVVMQHLKSAQQISMQTGMSAGK
jgi:putative membrane protein